MTLERPTTLLWACSRGWTAALAPTGPHTFLGAQTLACLDTSHSKAPGALQALIPWLGVEKKLGRIWNLLMLPERRRL